MCDKATNQEIGEYLQEVKSIIAVGGFDFIPRFKNMQALAKAKLTPKDAKSEVFDLTVSNYYKGPKKDFERPGMIWEFKKSIDCKTFYIKLKIVEECGKKVVKCMGFHDDDFNM